MNRVRSFQRSCMVRLGALAHRAQPFWGARPNGKCEQLMLMLRYRELAARGAPLPSVAEVGFRAYSQNDEDGILLYLLSVGGAAARTVVEMCVEDGIECNAANLIVNHGWTGLLFDGSDRNVRRANRFYGRHPDTWLRPPRVVQAWITRDNVNALVTGNGLRGEVDVLSIDLDGVDYWVWHALTDVRPRIVVVEYRQQWGPTAAVTVPYRETFNRADGHPEFWGASLAAFVRLGDQRGYRLVGCDRTKTNAFFLRDDVAAGIVPRVAPGDCTDFAEPSPGLPTGHACVWEAV